MSSYGRLDPMSRLLGVQLWAPATGRAQSDVEIVGCLAVGASLVTNNLVFVSTGQATYAIDLATHRAVFGYPASGKLALSPNGILYIHNTTELIAINVK